MTWSSLAHFLSFLGRVAVSGSLRLHTNYQRWLPYYVYSLIPTFRRSTWTATSIGMVGKMASQSS